MTKNRRKKEKKGIKDHEENRERKKVLSFFLIETT
jgi:hypothetical protein